MKNFKLNALVTISIYTTIEAETLEQAIKESERRSIEHAHLNDVEDQAKEVWVSDEFDGMPYRIILEKEG